MGELGKETEVFEVEQTVLFYSRQQGNYLQDPRLKRLRQESVVEQAMHFRRKGLPFSTMLLRLNYNTAGVTRSTHPGWTNQMSSIP